MQESDSQQPALAPAELPADVGDFTGRTEQVARIFAQFERSDGAVLPRPTICAISGKPGVGKSALAIHAAHLLKPLFPDGQLYANLGGGLGSPGGTAGSSVVPRFLRALGMTLMPQAVAADEQAALYRSALSGRRVLVALDDVQDASQVRSLMPGAGTCGVLMTSRQRLSTLAADDFCELDDMEPGEGVELLSRVAGRDRVDPEPEAAGLIVRYCGGLPLAIRIVGATLKSKRHWSVARVADDLVDERRRLDGLRCGDLDVRSSFAVSYGGLRPDQARAFRLLGLVPGLDFGVDIVAATVGIDGGTTERLLEELFEAQLLVAMPDGKYRLHDLVRLFSREQCDLQEPGRERRAVETRAFEQCRDAATRHAGALERTSLAQAHGPTHSPADSVQSSLAWFDREWPNLVAALGRAHEIERFDIALELSSALGEFFTIQVHWEEEETTYNLAVESARRIGDLKREAEALNCLAAVYSNQCRWDEAAGLCMRALAVFRGLDDRNGQAHALRRLGVVRLRQDRWADACTAEEQALAMFREVGDRRSEGRVLNSLGVVYGNQGRWGAAIDCYAQCLDICGRVDDRHTEGLAFLNLGFCYQNRGWRESAMLPITRAAKVFDQLNDRDCKGWAMMGLGIAYHDREQWSDAVTCYDFALDTFVRLGDRHGQAWVLTSLGRTYCEQGRSPEAARCHREAVALFRDQGSPSGRSTTLNHAGELLRQMGRCQAAIDLHLEALDICDRIDDSRGRAGAMAALGDAHRANGSWQEAEAWYQRSLDAHRQLTDHHGECTLQGALGELERSRHQWSAATARWQASLAVAREGGYDQEAARALLGLGDISRDCEQWEEAEARYDKALAAYRQLEYRSRGECLAVHGLAELHRRQGRLAQAVAGLDQALVIFRHLGDLRCEGSALIAVGAAYAELGSHGDVLRCCRRRLDIVEAIAIHCPSDPAVELLNEVAERHPSIV